MRLAPISLAVLLVAAPLALLAPAASAKPYCTAGEPGCEGSFFCLYATDTCVPDPCRTTACTTAAAGEPLPVSTAAPEPWCVPTSGGLDYPSYLCVDLANPWCAVYHETSSDRGVRRACVPPQVSPTGDGLNPLEDHDGDGDMEVDPACVWGWSDECVVLAAECFQPYRRWFGIHCI